MKSNRNCASRRIQRAIALILIVSAGVLTIAFVAPGIRKPMGTLFATEAVAAQTKPATTPTTATTAVAKKEEPKSAAWVFQPDPTDSTALSLRQREIQIAQREQELKQAESRLETLRKEIEFNLGRSEDVLKSMQKMAGEADSSRNKELKRWVSIYTAMKPAQAGPIFAGLDPRFALQVLSQMEPKSAGKILENMPPAQAIALGQQLGLKHP